MAFLTRYVEDDHRPSFGEAARDLLVRAVAPAVLLFGAIVGFGFLLKGPLKGLSDSEESVSKDLAAGRTQTWNTITTVWSHIGNTEYVIAVCVLVALIVLWRTKEWWYAIVPVVAISIQATVFVLATLVVDRARPHVEHLDPAPPTSSYPSGHVGAATALYITFALMAQRIERAWLRRLVTAVCVIIPFLVAYARLYRGMHHLVDILVGAINGIVCCLLAWHYLRRRTDSGRVGARAREAVSR
jgi:undecaprenyl-diphosphatase